MRSRSWVQSKRPISPAPSSMWMEECT